MFRAFIDQMCNETLFFGGGEKLSGVQYLATAISYAYSIGWLYHAPS